MTAALAPANTTNSKASAYGSADPLPSNDWLGPTEPSSSTHDTSIRSRPQPRTVWIPATTASGTLVLEVDGMVPPLLVDRRHHDRRPKGREQWPRPQRRRLRQRRGI